MTARITTGLTSIARPLLAGTAALITIGALLASAGLALGWFVYLAGFAASAIAVPAIGALHAGRIGRLGTAAFAFATVALVLGVPVIAMVAGFVARNAPLHDALMPYAVTVFGMFGLFGTLAGLLFVGLAIVRAGVLPARAGWLIAAAPIVDLPVEFGLLPLPVWGVAVTMLAAGLVLIARATVAPAAGAGARRGLAAA